MPVGWLIEMLGLYLLFRDWPGAGIFGRTLRSKSTLRWRQRGFQKSSVLFLGGYIAPKFKERPLLSAVQEYVGSETNSCLSSTRPKTRGASAAAADRRDI